MPPSTNHIIGASMIRVEWKSDPNSFLDYIDFDEFSENIKSWHLSSIEHTSPMEIFLKYYNLYIDGIRYEA